MVTAPAGLGLRIGELIALRVQDVDFLRRSVRVEHQVDRLTRELVAPKTARSRRTVPLPAVVSVALAEHIRQFPPADNGLLFHTRDGLPLHHDWYQNKTFRTGLVEGWLSEGHHESRATPPLRQRVVGCGGVRHRGGRAART
jgi:integrase